MKTNFFCSSVQLQKYALASWLKLISQYFSRQPYFLPKPKKYFLPFNLEIKSNNSITQLLRWLKEIIMSCFFYFFFASKNLLENANQLNLLHSWGSLIFPTILFVLGLTHYSKSFCLNWIFKTFSVLSLKFDWDTIKI